jgi:hypothetical protein
MSGSSDPTTEKQAMGDEQVGCGALSLSDCEEQVKELEACTRPLRAAQRERARDLARQIYSTTWQAPEQRSRAHDLVLRLGVLVQKG